MAPYRTVEREEHVEAPQDPGIVGDVIAQFADELAFLRELVQNAIDAGTAQVEVRLEHEDRAGIVRVSVRDRGEGMTRDIIENQLLVLFRSTKEKDDTKIGKFGIGFASVLLPRPRLVIVQTVRDGRRLTLHLYPDLTYQLFDGGAASQAGTTVELELPVRSSEAAGEAAWRSEEALRRWCRHATVPIHFVASVPLQEIASTVRIDEPLGLGALVEVQGKSEDGKLTVVVGIVPAGQPPYAGFFNHGLMLHESHEPLVGRLAVKLQDGRLGHTLSRDDVRRDERFAQAVAFARQLAERALPAAAAAVLAAAADAPTRERYHEVAAAIEAAGIELRDEEQWIPLVEPVARLDGKRSMAASALGKRAWGAVGRSALSARLAEEGVEVIELGQGAARARLLARLRRLASCEVAEVMSQLTLVEPVAPSDAEAVLLDELNRLWAVVQRAPAGVMLARLEGAAAGEVAIAGGPREAAHVFDSGGYALDREATRKSPFSLLRAPPLVLSQQHPLLEAARRGDPRLAASHLARGLLLQYGLLTVERSEAILAATLTRLGVG